MRMRREGTDDIPAQECWELLRTVSVGRLALSVGALPAILPVQYCVDGDDLAACLGHYTIPEISVDDTIVAFAADDIGPDANSGWSVQILGRTSTRRGPSTPVNCGQPSPGQLIRIAPLRITGHRIHLCPFVSGHLGALG
jgi:uncharacterized protein